MKYIARSIALPMARISQSLDSQGKPTNLSRFQQFADDDYLRDLSADLKRNGQIEPCCVTMENPAELPSSHEAMLLAIESGDIRFRLVTGNNRYKAIQMFGGKELLCNIIEGSPAELLGVSISENLSKPLSPIDYAVAYYRMTLPEALGGAGLKERSVAARCNVSQGTVTNYLELLNLPRTFQEMIHDSDQNTGLWRKDNDGEKMHKLRPTKALQLLREARKYVLESTGIKEKDDPEGFSQHVNLALGRVLMQFEKGYTPDAGPKIEPGFWRVEAIWPEGSRKETNSPQTTTTTESPQTPQSTSTTSTTDEKGGANNPQPLSAKGGGVKPDKKERADITIVSSFVGNLRKDTTAAFTGTNPVSYLLQALDVYLAKMAQVTLDESDKIDELETGLSRAVLKVAKETNSMTERIQELESFGKGKAVGAK